MSIYFAHITDEGRRQTVEDHLRGCAQLCALFASSFGAEQFGYLAGIMHDIGKYTSEFQLRLDGGPKVDHSSAGALECALAGQLSVGIGIAGHHTGLPDYGNERIDHEGDPTFVGRLKRAMALRGTTSLRWDGPIPQTPNDIISENDFELSFWIRMLYSCLVDADFLDTEKFMKNGSVVRGGYESIDSLLSKLNLYTSKWENATTELNEIRNQIRYDCIKSASDEKGLFSLTVPTGGGKTVSSLAFALNHAAKYGLSRVIYVIPYTSIIEQNAAVFRSILGDMNVVEHHSEVQYDYGNDFDYCESKNALAAENWDAPIVVTTAVQFFESLYSNKPSKCRKLHNIANSVVIFDEIQSIPVDHLLPCMASVGTLVKNFGVSAVLCSATQPFVSDLLKKYAPNNPVREICSDVDGLFSKLSRVKYLNEGPKSLETLAAELCKKKQVLCIVNKRKTAKNLFDHLPEEGSFHLSTLMTPRDRTVALETIRQRLENGLVCRVISTSLIEAGVDIDFPCVYREMAGLDSIVQAAGRCNRERKRDKEDSIVTIFELDEKPPKLLRVNIGAAREAVDAIGEIDSKRTVDLYFRALRSFVGQGNIDVSDTVNHLNFGISGCRLPFKEVAESFHLINTNMFTVYIPTDESEGLIEQLKNGTSDKRAYRDAGHFSVNIYPDHYHELYESGCIEELGPGMAVLVDTSLYNKKTGLSLAANYGQAEFV